MLSILVQILRVANWLNWTAAALFTFLLVLLIVDPGVFRENFAEAFRERGASEAVFDYLRWTCALVIPVAIAIHIIFTRLVAMIRDTQAGEAFSETNARRLSVIAWALLAINFLDLAFGYISVRASEASGEYFGWTLALTGWFAVPLLFVLARVLREGAAMREDLEGTV